MDARDDVVRPRVRLRRATWDKEVRALGLRSNAACASLLRTSESTISRIKNNEVEPSQKFIASAIWRFDVKFEDMFEIVCAKAAP